MFDETLAPEHAGSWSAPADQLKLALRQPVRARLVDVGVIAVSGPDAAAFLNGQVTVDMDRTGPHQWQLGACCSSKGRVLAIFESWRAGDVLFLAMPSDRIGPTLGRLSRFVLRAKVQLQDVSNQWELWGLTGHGAQSALEGAGFACTEPVWTVGSPDAGVNLSRVPPSPSTGARFVLALAPQAGDVWRRPPAGFSEVEPAVWWWSKIDAGLPDVFAVTEERFLPQALNLDVLGGVHFGKGCYTGQEVIARSQYLGKLRRRMVRAHARQARAGEDVMANVTADRERGADGGTVAGTVVMAAASPTGGVDLLVECPTDLARPGALRIAGPQPSELTLHAMPYPIINPTA
jgi:tRNA-modifying protein YgfZ